MSRGFADEYRRVFERIYGEPPRAKDGVSATKIAKAEERLGQRLPAALREFYEAVGGSYSVVDAHNHITPVDELEIVNGRVCFCDENQSVCDWVIALEDQDPAVEQRMDGNVYDMGSCSQFLGYVMYMQACFGGLELSGFRDVDEDVLRKVAKWEKVADQEGLAIYQRGGMLVAVADGAEMLNGAARTEDDRAWLEEHLGFEF